MKHTVYLNSFDKDPAYHAQLARDVKAIKLPPIVRRRTKPCYPPIKVSRVRSFAAQSHTDKYHRENAEAMYIKANNNITFDTILLIDTHIIVYMQLLFIVAALWLLFYGPRRSGNNSSLSHGVLA